LQGTPSMTWKSQHLFASRRSWEMREEIIKEKFV
jgi:hypothetical protein